MKTAIIIGSGIAGLATSIRLACDGWAVSVFEQNKTVGGKISTIEHNGYTFDTGPSLFTQPSYIEELFTLAQEDISQYFSYTKHPTSCHYFFDDGTKLHAKADANDFAKTLHEIFNEDENQVRKYLKSSESAFEKIGTLFTQFSLHQLSTFSFSRIWKAIKATKWQYLMQSLHSYNYSFFKHKNTIQLFNRFATYNGSNPYKAPAMLSMIPHFEVNVGTYYPKGGMVQIAKALHKLAIKKGVQFNTSHTVNTIVESNNIVKGITVNDTFFPADIVVSNMDAYFTYSKLLNNLNQASKFLKQERSSSAFIFYWGINRNYNELDLHNILFCKNYEKEFDALFTDKQIINDTTIYINITSKCEQNQAPTNCENWFVMINTPAHYTQNWEVEKVRIKKIIVNKINQHLNTDIEKHIVFEDYLSPAMIESKTMSYTGSLYGSSSNSKTSAFMRQRNKSELYKNLYFVGGSVHPGGGIPLCLGSAKIVAGLVHQNHI